MGKKEKKGEGGEREKKNSRGGEQENTDGERRKESGGEGVDKLCETGQQCGGTKQRSRGR